MDILVGILIFLGVIIAAWLLFGGGDLTYDILRAFANSKMQDRELAREEKRINLRLKEAELQRALKDLE